MRGLKTIGGTVALLLSSFAIADPSVTCSPGPPQVTHTITQLPSGKWVIEIHNASATLVAFCTIQASTSDELLEVCLTADSGANQTFLFLQGLTGATSRFNSIDRILGDNHNVFIQRLNTIGDVGLVDVDGTLENALIGGDLVGPVDLSTSNSGTGDIINSVVEGDVTGDLLLDEGNIVSLDVQGSIGTPSQPVTIQMKDSLFFLSATEIHADITTLVNGGSGVVVDMRTTGGDFTGSLETRRVANSGTAPSLSINGDCDANITLTQFINDPITVTGDLNGDIECDRIQADGAIIIDGELNGDIIIADPAGLTRQIVIGADDQGGQWNGLVSIDTLLLDGPYYTPESSSLGGGAVGLARYDFHAKESEPEHKAPASDPLAQAEVSYYGPVLASGSGTPVRIERLSWNLPFCIGDPCNCPSVSWNDVTNLFTIDVAPSGSPRDVVITPNSGSFDPGYYYRVIPRNGSDELICDLVTGTPPVRDHGDDVGMWPQCVDHDNYWFFIPQSFDMNSNGSVDEPDAACWVLSPTDFNGDSACDTQDLTLLINAIE